MPVPTLLSEMSVTPSLNSPQGTESAKGTIDDYLRAHAAFIKQTSDLVLGATVTLSSASTVNIGFAASSNVAITGTAIINGFDNYAEGALRHVTFSGAMLLVNSGAFGLPTAANITTVSGDTAIFKSLGGGNWKCMMYQRLSGLSLTQATASTSGYLSAGDWVAFNGKQPALGYAPVQQNGGIGQSTNKVYIGYAPAGGVKVTVDATDMGYIPFSTQSPDTGDIVFAKGLYANSFHGPLYGDGANITGLTGSQITTALGYAPQAALGFTPYNSTNPSGYISSITSGNVTTALGFTPQPALGFTPYNSTNPAGYITSINSGNVTTALGFTPQQALGFTPYNSTNPAGYLASINSGHVTTALGFTPQQALGFTPANAAGQAFSGNISAPVVTQTSDERKKCNWRPLTDAQLDALANMELAGLFDWKDGSGTSLGGSAQEIARIVPEAQHEDAEGNITVNYGGLCFAMQQATLRRLWGTK